MNKRQQMYLNNAWDKRLKLLKAGIKLTRRAKILRIKEETITLRGMKLYSLGSRIRSEGLTGESTEHVILWAKGTILVTQANLIYNKANQIRAKKDLLFTKRDMLRAKGNLLWAEAVLKTLGNISMNWNNNPLQCHLQTGEIFKEEFEYE